MTTKPNNNYTIDPDDENDQEYLERAAELCEVSVAATKQAARVMRYGIPEIIAAVEDGSVSLDWAVGVVNFSPKTQLECLKGRLPNKDG